MTEPTPDAVSDERLRQLRENCNYHCDFLAHGECRTRACLKSGDNGRVVLPLELVGCETLHQARAFDELLLARITLWENGVSMRQMLQAINRLRKENAELASLRHQLAQAQANDARLTWVLDALQASRINGKVPYYSFLRALHPLHGCTNVNAMRAAIDSALAARKTDGGQS